MARKTGIKYLFFACMLVLAVGITPESSECATGKAPYDKVVVFVVDNIDFKDLQQGNSLPNFNKIIRGGAIGLMNTRTRANLVDNPASAYLTLGMGVRTHIPDQIANRLYFDSKGVPGKIRLRDEKLLKDLEVSQQKQFGRLGDVARANGKNIFIVGNADSDKPQNLTALIAMDSQGVIEKGYIASNLLVKDAQFAWGHRTNPTALLKYCKEALKTSELVFLDYGDTTRIRKAEQSLDIARLNLEKMKLVALKNADIFLGELLEIIDQRKMLLMVISPTSPEDIKYSGMKNLAPIIIYGSGVPAGLLTSGTTMRPGLVSNIDIGPTILANLGINITNTDFYGEVISSVPASNSLGIVTSNLKNYISIKTLRYFTYGVYVVLLTIAVATLFVPMFTGKKVFNQRTGRALALMVLAVPITSFVGPSLSNYNHLLAVMVFILLATLGFGIGFSRNTGTTLSGIALLSFSTYLFIIIDSIGGYGLLLNTPLGFADVFTGGRYYGINNDCLGILFGSTVYTLFFIIEKTKLSRNISIIIALIVFSLAVLTQTPKFGANVGGTIAGMTIGLMTIIVMISNRPLSWKKLTVTMLSVFFIEFVIAYFDSFAGQSTHAGKTITALLENGIGVTIREVLKSKLGIFLVMLIVPPWNLLLAVQLFIIVFSYKYCSAECMTLVKNEHSNLYQSFKIILWGAIAVFAFNDTGIIASSIMLTYLTMPLGVLGNSEFRDK